MNQATIAALEEHSQECESREYTLDRSSAVSRYLCNKCSKSVAEEEVPTTSDSKSIKEAA